ncbi:YajQ family cyclic di-GMP-binding protein [Nocardiopsis sp. FIRDI 009]|uniref:YajQ family cyclic di-GMP-binding protein n=1 Tax=Nocardiopsis sp. FIRDI 009 TaxID=714197 RepID=UPI000E21F8EE|nr:YajQ family cyclic di-GMP-binding protein [Nocardiopsis sp. FIRDI 009]
MAAESSFDVVSKLDRQEVDNALNQAGKELAQRFDFKGTGTTIAWQGENGIEIRSGSEERATAALEVFKEKLIKRKISLKVLDPADEPKPSGKEYRLPVNLKEGISSEDAKKISKLIRDEGPKGVKAQIQGDELRVSSKKKDDLQSVMKLIEAKDFDLALQFVNYR